MKRIIAFLMAVVMCLLLTACGKSEQNTTIDDVLISSDISVTEETITENNISIEETPLPEETKMSKEEMLAIAEEYTMKDILQDTNENLAKAKQKYCDKTILLSGVIRSIQEEYFELSTGTSTSLNCVVNVYLALDELVLLEKGQYITVVGTISNEILSSSSNKQYQMPDAYFVNDIYELTGTLTFYYKKLLDVDGKLYSRNGNPDAWVICLDTTEDQYEGVNYHMEEAIPVNHVSGKAIGTVTFGGQELKSGSKITVSGKIIRGFDETTIKEAKLISVH